MATSKYRIYEMARDMNMSSKRLQMILKREFNLEYKSHMSAIEEDDIGRIESYFEEQKKAAQEDREKRERAREKAEAQAAKDREKKKREKTQSSAKSSNANNSNASRSQNDGKQNRRQKNENSRRQNNRPKQYSQGMSGDRMLTPDMIKREEEKRRQKKLEELNAAKELKARRQQEAKERKAAELAAKKKAADDDAVQKQAVKEAEEKAAKEAAKKAADEAAKKQAAEEAAKKKAAEDAAKKKAAEEEANKKHAAAKERAHKADESRKSARATSTDKKESTPTRKESSHSKPHADRTSADKSHANNKQDVRKKHAPGRNDRHSNLDKDDAVEVIAKPSRLHDHKKVDEKKMSNEKSEKKRDRDRDMAQKLQSKAANKEKKKEKKILKELAEQKESPEIIELPAEITVGDFAKLINKSSTEVMMELIKMGVMASLNEAIGYETAEKVAESFDILVTEPEATDPQTMFKSLDPEDAEKDLKARPPVVTVMGHVDHGKTSLLDAIRETHVTQGEAGGITQHIGASTAYVDGKKITFLDTPGHEAFTQMRMRGAQSTDIAILVVAADDGVMPQTIEAINHAKAAKVPIIVAINKMDKYEADPNRVMQELTEYGLVAEDWGGDTIMIPVSAKDKTGIDDLLTMILMVAEMEELKANPNRRAVGIVIEAQLDKGRGPTATVLVKKGTLHDSDYVVSGTTSGHIRAMFDSTGKKIKKVGPSMPALILGLNDVPEAGDMIYAVENEKIARDYAQKALDKQKQEQFNKTSRVSLDDLHTQIEGGELKELNIIVKTDVKGTIEAVRNSLEKLSNEEVKVNVIHGAVGGITESDVLLANASNALIIGFNVRPNQGAVEQGKNDGIDIRTYRVIYEAIDDVKQAIQGMLSPKFKEQVLGQAEVRDTFRLPNGSTIAGVYVTNGKLARNAQIRLVRDDIVIHEGKISSLRRFKDDVRELASGYEGGVGIENYNDIKLKDVIECFQMVEIEPAKQ